jgi:hypothetical protein
MGSSLAAARRGGGSFDANNANRFFGAKLKIVRPGVEIRASKREVRRDMVLQNSRVLRPWIVFWWQNLFSCGGCI